MNLYVWYFLAFVALVWFLDAAIHLIRKNRFFKKILSRHHPENPRSTKSPKDTGWSRLEVKLQNFQARMNAFIDRRNKKIVHFYEHTLNNGKKSYLSRMGFVQMFWIFIISDILGSVFETLWCIATYGKFEMRTSFVYGFFIPIYGFGAVMMSLCLCRFYKVKNFWLFLGGAFIGGTVEVASSLYQEIAFGTRSWDYSNTLLSIGGRTNLMFSLIWGTLGVLWVKDFYPAVATAIGKIPKKTGRALIIIFSVVIILDATLTTLALYRQTERKKGHSATNIIELYLDQTFSDKYLNWVYPHMTFIK